jgi:hypothetical protein
MWIEVEEVVGLGADEVVRGGWSATVRKGQLILEQCRKEEEEDTQRCRHSEEGAEQP